MEATQKNSAPSAPILRMDEIKNMISQGAIQPVTTDVIASGQMVGLSKGSVRYTVHYGWDIAKCLACDEQWIAFNFKLIKYIKEQNFDSEKLKQALGGIQVDDHHWRWFNKALALSSDSYHWFFVMVDKIPQAACLVFHPKESAFEKKNIYYIDYIAIAPWNRKNPMVGREFSGVGGLLVKEVVNYLYENKKIGLGFSLHSLPKAEGFYERIGMVGHEDFNKDGLKYFEMREAAAKLYMVKK